MADIKTAFRTNSISLDNVVAIFQGNLDPRTNDQGNITQVPQGSLYIRSNGELYQKTGTANLAFSLITATGSAVTILDTDLSNTLTLLEGSNLTSERTLTFTTGDASRVLTINGNATLNDWFDQSVKTTGTPTFAQMFSTGNVGIGTTSPSSKLHVNGSIEISNLDNSKGLVLGTAHGGLAPPTIIAASDNTASARFTFNINSLELMRIRQDGRLGLGTTSPQTKLHVLSSGTPTSPIAGTVGVFQKTGIGENARLAIIGSSSASSVLDMGDENNQFVQSIACSNISNYMAFITNAAERMRIDSSGNVGIGTTNPTVALDVVGDIKATGTITGTLSFTRFQVQTSGASATPTGDIVAKFEKSATTESAAITILSSAAGISSLNMGDTVSEVVGNIAYSNASNYMAFTTNSSEAMRIDSSGFVGIGTNAPASTLDVVGNIAVSGTVDGVDLSAWLDQSVKTTASPTFANATIGGTVFNDLIAGNSAFSRLHVQTDGSGAAPSGDTVAIFEKSLTSTGNATVSIVGGPSGSSTLALNVNPSVSKIHYDTSNGLSIYALARKRMEMNATQNIIYRSSGGFQSIPALQFSGSQDLILVPGAFTNSGFNMQFVAGINGFSNIYFTDAANNLASIKFDHANHTFNFNTGDSGAQVILRGVSDISSPGRAEIWGGIGASAGTSTIKLKLSQSNTTIRFTDSTEAHIAEFQEGGSLFYHASSLAPTGGMKGAGTINAGGLYDDGSILTCYVLEAANTGIVDLEFWKSVDPKGIHQRAIDFSNNKMNMLDLKTYSDFWKSNSHLPSMPSRDGWVHNSYSVGDFIGMLWETTELHAVHVDEIYNEVESLKQKIFFLENEIQLLKNV